MAVVRHIEDCHPEDERTLFGIEAWLIHLANGYEKLNVADVQIGVRHLFKEYFPRSAPCLESEG
jgi:hypothetical protein